MDELTIGDKVYISSKRAAKITGYAKDYVGQLCREGRVEARLVGRNWYVLESSITEHRFGAVETEAKVAGEPKEQESKPYQWSSPTYEAEVPIPVPSLIRKEPEVQASRKVVSEMQAAWQEWFAQQPAPLEAANEPVQQEVEPKDTEDLQEEEPVLFTAVHEEQTPEESISVAPYQASPEPEYTYSAMTEVMDLSRAQEPVPTYLEAEEEPYVVQEEGVTTTKGTMTVLKALLIGSACVACAAALVGTGIIGDVLSNSYGTDSQLGKAIKYLGGESEYVNSK